MLLPSLRLLLFSGFALSLTLNHSQAIAQSNSTTGDVVVPTMPSGDTVNRTPRDSSSPVVSSNRFICQLYKGQYTVMYQPESIPGRLFPWATTKALGDGWSPQRRCEAIASRLEAYRPDGLQELRISALNNENIVCVTTDTNPSCRIVLTVPRGQDPILVRHGIFENLMTADTGGETQPINTYRSSNGRGNNDLYNLGRTMLNRNTGAVNLKPFLSSEDGGTLGSKPGNNRPSAPPNGNILNPDNFR